VIQNTTEPSLHPLTLVVALDEGGRAEGTLYEDAGEGFEHLAGMYLKSTYEARQTGDKVVVKLKNEQGAMERPQRMVNVELITGTGVLAASGDEVQGIELTIP
jgi:alpha-glucosidase